MVALVQDPRLAFRQLRKAPGIGHSSHSRGFARSHRHLAGNLVACKHPENREL